MEYKKLILIFVHQIKKYMKEELIKALENAIGAINPNDAALSYQIKDNSPPVPHILDLRVVQNSENSEIPVITTFIKTVDDFYLMNGLNQLDDFQYTISVRNDNEVIIIEFLIRDTENF
jgi:hypothetical protein